MNRARTSLQESTYIQYQQQENAGSDGSDDRVNPQAVPMLRLMDALHQTVVQVGRHGRQLLLMSVDGFAEVGVAIKDSVDVVLFHCCMVLMIR